MFTFAVIDLLETGNTMFCENETFSKKSLLKQLVDRLLLYPLFPPVRNADVARLLKSTH